MNPDLEDHLQNAFKTLQPTNPAIGRVVVEPEYESEASPAAPEVLLSELKDLLTAFQLPEGHELPVHAGEQVSGLDKCPHLKEIVRRVSLHGDREDGPWVEVAPPGYWI